jgi:hypothetical protein
LAVFFNRVLYGLSDVPLNRATCNRGVVFLLFVKWQIKVIQSLLGYFLKIPVATGLFLRDVWSDGLCLKYFGFVVTL